MTDNSIMVSMGNNSEIEELKERIKKMLPVLIPGGSKLTDDEALALSQVSILHDLSPFLRELYLLKGSDGKSYGVMPGIYGYRKSGRASLPATDSYWLEFVELSPSEANVDDPSKVHYAIKCILRDTVTMKRYTEMVSNVAKIYEPKSVADESKLAELRAEIRAIVGPPPLYIGFGVIYKYELTRLGAARINPLQQARIRAERQALRLRFDINIKKNIPPEVEEEFEAEASILDGSDDTVIDATPMEEAKILKELGYQTEKPAPDPLRYSPVALKERLAEVAKGIRSKIADGKAEPCTGTHRKILAAALGKIPGFDQNTTRYETTDYLTGCASTKDLPGEYVKAMLAWLEVTSFEDEPSQMAKREAIKAHEAALIDKGQIPMEGVA